MTIRAAGISVAMLGLVGAVAPCTAQDFTGRELRAALAKIEQMRRDGKEIPPAPRLANGHPDLGNEAGSWFGANVGDMSGGDRGTGGNTAATGGGARPEKAVEVAFLPWAKKAFDERQANFAKDDPESLCLPPGSPRVAGTAYPFQIYQLSNRVIFLYEKLNLWNIVWMDGRKHTPLDKLNPTFYGESIGHWDGDTLVVDIIGHNELSWIDSAGHPKTEKLHLIERWTRVNRDIMHYEVTVDDPGAYSKPWTSTWNMLFHPGAELLDYICVNNPDPQHMVGK